jgi:hypothetical protein
MAIPSLDQRLSTMLPQQAADGQAPQEAPDIQPELADPTDSDPMEPVQVAGIGSGVEALLKKTITKAAPKAERNIMPDAARLPEGELADPLKAGRYKVLEPADQKLTDTVTDAVNARKAGGAENRVGKPSPSAEETAMGVPVEPFNLSRYQTEDPAAIVGGVADALGIKTKAVTFDEIKAKGREMGMPENFVSRLLDNDGKMMSTAVETYKALEVLEESAKELDTLFKKVAQGDATDIEKLQLRQQIAFHGMIQKGVKGMQTETARALAVFRIPRDANSGKIRALLDEYGGDNSLTDLADKYMTIESRAARNALVEKSMMSGLKDVWFTTFINGLLSSVPTHMKNITGNTLLGLYQIPERYVASLYSNYAPQGMRAGELPTGFKSWGELVPGAADEKYAMSEAGVMASSLVRGMQEGLILASKAWKTGQASDLMSKIEMQRGMQETTGETLQRITGASPDTWLGKSLDYYGSAIQAPGKALLSEDEFFKGVLYRMDLNAQIQRRTEKTYSKALADGMSLQDAEALAVREAQDLHANPPSDMDKAASDFAARGTFTSELPEGVLRDLQKLFNNPLLKPVVPFFKTPANIGLEVVERTPFAPISSRWREDMAKGGIHRDMALAKMTLGSSLIATYGYMAGEGLFTGRGPERKADRDALERNGWKPYSMKIGDAYYSYSGLEPMGAMIAIAADYAEYAKYSDDDSATQEVFMGAVFGIYSYLSEQPALQGAADVVNLVLGRRNSAGDSVNGQDVINQLAKQYGGFAIGGSPIGAYNSAVASIDRLLDPTKKDTRANPDLPMGVRGFVEAFNQYRSRLPMFSNDLPEDLNLWGEPILRSHGNPLEILSPTKVSPVQFSDVDDALWRLGSPISMPNRKIDGVELTAEQMNRLKTIYGKELNAKDQLRTIINSAGFANLPKYNDENPGQSQQGSIAAAHSKLMQQARAQLISEYPDLQTKFENLHELRLSRGKYAKPD